jgi:hypothetical protein
MLGRVVPGTGSSTYSAELYGSRRVHSMDSFPHQSLENYIGRREHSVRL